MLVLSRKKSEVVMVTLPDGREISVTVCEVRGEKVRIGFEAPADVAVHRQEVHEAVRRSA